MPLHETRTVEHAVLAQVIVGRRDPAEAADSLLELGRLADTAGLVAVGQVTQRRPKADVATLMGEGKVVDLRTALETSGAEIALFDNELDALQAHNLQKALGARVMDRTEVILQIFARRARSAEAQVQVELAQLQFMLSRIPVLEAQQRFKGGIGMKGPGESRLQLRNAPIRRRIDVLKKRMAEIQARQARSRDKRRWPVVSLVGYTNAGKSTLLNVLAGADAYVDDRLFATLDTKTRLVWLGTGRKILLTDTVGFIRHLPHALVASFRSTLDVAVQADLLLVVVDASHPHVRDHIDVCQKTITEIGAGKVPALLVLNKCDAPGADETVAHAAEGYPLSVPVSARTGYGLDTLKLAIVEELRKCCTLWRLPSATSAT
jgi:GTP-binding protein HflX